MLVTRSFEIKNRLGIHARVAAKIVHAAVPFKSRITLEFKGQEVNAKSILGILTLACPRGSHLSVVADGSDAQEAMEALGQLILDKFGED